MILKNHEEGNDDDSCDNIPEDCYLSENTNRCHDWRVGHGLVDTDKALTLTGLSSYERPNEDGFLDYPEATVWDAYKHYEDVMDTRGLTSVLTNLGTHGKVSGVILMALLALLALMQLMIGTMYGSQMEPMKCKSLSVP